MERVIGKDWQFNHIGVIVRDLDKAVKYYESLGIFTLQKEFGGGPGAARMRMADSGNNHIELIAPTTGPPLFREFLDKNGEGIHHIAYDVSSLDAAISGLTGKGIPVILSLRFPDGGGIAFFDFRKIGGVVIELMEHPSKT
jgi:methylmalonyl-CoA/ethylmalonyl-CoA epimerase